MNILVLDDDMWMLELLDTVLTENGYQMSKALNSYSAFKMFQTITFDLIISDIHMPHPNGIEFGKMIRKENSLIPIIYFSAELNGPDTYAADIQAITNAFYVEDKQIETLLEIIRRYKNCIK